MTNAPGFGTREKKTFDEQDGISDDRRAPTRHIDLARRNLAEVRVASVCRQARDPEQKTLKNVTCATPVFISEATTEKQKMGRRWARGPMVSAMRLFGKQEC